jgi:DNA-binding LytR/AlgR family response regulator
MNDLNECDELESHLKRYFYNTSYSYEISKYQSGKLLLDDFKDGLSFDVVILNTKVGKVLGIDVAKTLRTLQYNGVIAFVAASPKFAVEGYEVQAMGYLLTPISEQKFKNMMDTIVGCFRYKFYMVQRHSNVCRVPYDHILYVESDNSRCILHTTDGKQYHVYKQLNTIQKELNDQRFLRCHQSYLVNMHHIQSVDKNFTLTTGDVVYIRQRAVKAMRDEYVKYMSLSSDNINGI